MVKCFQEIVTQAKNCYNLGVHVFFLFRCGFVTNNFNRDAWTFYIISKVATWVIYIVTRSSPGYVCVIKEFRLMSQNTSPPPLTAHLRLLTGLLVIGLALGACSSPPAPEVQASLPEAAENLLPTPLARTATLIPELDSTATVFLPATSTPTATVTATPTPTLHPMQIAAMRAVEYPGSDLVVEETLDPGSNYDRYYVHYLSEGLKIYALLTVPRGEQPATGWPVIIFNHGYIPPTVYRTTERYIAYVDNLARSGYVVLRVDYRGHDRSEGEPTGAYGDPGYTVDVLNAVATMRRYPGADPERIGMWGTRWAVTSPCAPW